MPLLSALGRNPAIGFRKRGRGYQIANSLRLRASASAYLSRTPSVSGNSQKWTWSGWVKRGTLGTQQMLFCAGNSPGGILLLIGAGDNIRLTLYVTAAETLVSNPVIRDPSAWYHIVLAVDTTQAIASDRVRLYVNGVQTTSFSSTNYPAQNATTQANTSGYQHTFGKEPFGSSWLFDGYTAEQYVIDGQALDPTSFGQFNSDGVWVPKAYTGTYGTNGFYLKFNDGSNLTNLCLDRSGNGNNWTATNVSLTAGATYDWMVDTPTNNYCVLSLDKDVNITLANGNLSQSDGSASWVGSRASIGVSSGKWYWEYFYASGQTISGLMTAAAKITATTGFPGGDSNGWGYYSSNGNKYNGGATGYGAAYAANDIIGVAFDADAGTLTFYKNGVSQGVAYTGLTSGPYFPAFGHNTTNLTVNFGQRPFAYTPPTGFKSLCTANLPAVTIPNGRKHFDVLTWVGNNTAGRNITGLQFQPDLSWAKNRTAANNNMLFDSVRTAGKLLISDLTNAESTTTGGINAFNADGIQIGYDGSAIINQTGNNYVNWNWKAGGAAVTNNAGSITSQVSANTTAGFSIVTYANGSANGTVGHGLGTPLKMAVIKRRGAGTNTANWVVWHSALSGGVPSTSTVLTLQSGNVLTLNTTNAVGAYTADDQIVGAASGYLALCFAEVPGFSKFGSYTGNGSADGPFVFCGFRPRWVLLRSSSVGGAGYSWVLYDTARSPENAADEYLFPNLSDAESVNASAALDLTANGFKLRTAGNAWNQSGQTFIFTALAENPFGGANTAPATAR